MSSYRQLLYHIVFRTKDSYPVLAQDKVDQLYAYIGGIIRNKNSLLYKVNGVENHIHILTDLHPSVALADFLREIKGSSSKWLGEKGLFPGFKGWAEGYGAFSCSYMDVGKVTDYIKNQEEHHKKRSFEDELRRLILEAGLNIDEKYFP